MDVVTADFGHMGPALMARGGNGGRGVIGWLVRDLSPGEVAAAVLEPGGRSRMSKRVLGIGRSAAELLLRVRR